MQTTSVYLELPQCSDMLINDNHYHGCSSRISNTLNPTSKTCAGILLGTPQTLHLVSNRAVYTLWCRFGVCLCEPQTLYLVSDRVVYTLWRRFGVCLCKPQTLYLVSNRAVYTLWRRFGVCLCEPQTLYLVSNRAVYTLWRRFMVCLCDSLPLSRWFRAILHADVMLSTHFRIGSGFVCAMLCHCLQGFAQCCMLKSCCPHIFASVLGLFVRFFATVYRVSRDSACSSRAVHTFSRRLTVYPCDSLPLSTRLVHGLSV